MRALSRLLQRGIFFLSFGRVAGRRSGIHGGKGRLDPATERVKFLGELFRRKKPPAAKKSCSGSSEIAELSSRR
jgi:hypothetical protein